MEEKIVELSKQVEILTKENEMRKQENRELKSALNEISHVAFVNNELGLTLSERVAILLSIMNFNNKE